ncbi:hypothetical protein DNTS_026642 [Danionella cerebrum]|uniref:Macrophage mannose receptor 1 n=1 Tax=Danionella cerebrum TaxID=2873325 RepID=A0A553Q2Q9_9TELE|nr:hypothetical protein DNTS_026642 [Danionella translucida]
MVSPTRRNLLIREVKLLSRVTREEGGRSSPKYSVGARQAKKPPLPATLLRRTGDREKRGRWKDKTLRRLSQQNFSFRMFLLLLIFFCSHLHYGWRPYEERCYLFSSDVKTWHEALEVCIGKSANLMSIQDLHERSWLRTQTGASIYWIGLNDVASEGNWEWSDGSTYYPYLSFWKPGQPDNWAGDEDCGQVQGLSDGRWNDESCSAKRQYICKRPNPNPAPVCDSANGWHLFGSSCYKHPSGTRGSWASARSVCVSEGADLVSISSAEENQFVSARLLGAADLWIGFSTLKCTGLSCAVRPNSTSFSWSDASTSTYTNWPAGEPDLSDKASGVCTAMIIHPAEDHGFWRTRACREERAFMCERALNTICPSGWLSFGGHCYWMVTNQHLLTSWFLAQTHCSSLGATLLIIKSEDEQFFINAQLPDFHQVDLPDLWIGISDKDKDGTFRWVDKTNIEFSNWSPNFPQNTADQWDCGQIYTGNYAGKWETTNCFKSLGFICKMAGGQNIKPTPEPDSHCDPGYLLFGDHCFHFESKSDSTWTDAQKICEAQNGHLASVHDQERLSFLTAHMSRSSWIGLNDIKMEGTYVWSDGTPADFLPWEQNQPDNWQGDEDCVHIRGTEHPDTGRFNDLPCSATYPYICMKAKGQGPPSPPTAGPGWNERCGSWMADPFSEYCYLFSSTSLRPWAEARADCRNQGGDLLSITDPITQGFIQAHDSITEGGWTWTDGSPFRYINWAKGNPDDYFGEDCLSMLINSGAWNDDNCEYNRGYICKRRANTPEPPPPHNGFITAIACQDSSLVLHCPQNSVINIQSAFLGRRSDQICPFEDGSSVGKLQIKLDFMEAPAGCLPHPVQSSTDGISWKDGGEFPGSVDRMTPEVRLLGTSVSAQFIRVLPVEWNNQAGLRLEVLGCAPNYAVDCSARPNLDHSIDRMTVHCPAGCVMEPYTVFGTDMYRGDSSICAAAIHAGVVLDELGGDCTLLKEPGQNFYTGSTRNSIISRQYGGSYSVSFRFADGELRCSGPDWFEFGEFCYKSLEEKKTWHNARTFCRSLGADLVSIRSLTEQSWLESYLYTMKSDVWTGLNDLEFSGFFSWSDHHEMPRAHYPPPSVMPTIYGCLQGWDAFEYSCYWFEEAPRSREEAKAFCQGQNSTLLHIEDLFEQAHLSAVLMRFTGFWWMGLRARGEESGLDYYWDSGAPVTYTHWGRNQPDDRTGPCVAMATAPQAGFWNTRGCEHSLPFVCEAPRNGVSPPTPAPTLPPAAGCDRGWGGQPTFRNCYRLFAVEQAGKKSWSEARQDCLSRGADLLSIHTPEEEVFLSEFSRGRNSWIGLSLNPMEGGYHWSDGSPVGHTNWAHGEPNNHDGRENCVELVSPVNGSSSWNDQSCSARLDWICMISKGNRPIEPPTAPPPQPAPECGSNPGWRKHAGACYYYNDTDIVDFHMAMVRCYEEKSLLASIANEHEQEFIVSLVGTGQAAAAWIGMRMLGIAEGEYLWVDMSPVTYVHWAPGEPNDANGEEQCVQMNRYPGSWNDANCGRATAGYVCKKYPGSDHTAPPPTAPWEGNCPEGWLKFQNKCFLIQGKHRKSTELAMNWTSARDWCRKKDADLAVIDSLSENDMVSSYLRDVLGPVWIGLSDSLHEGRFAWSNGAPVLFTNWADKEPNNADGKEHCTSVTHYAVVSGRWNDENCDHERGWICSRKKSSSLPVPPTPASSCPRSYTPWFSSCFRLVTAGQSWAEARGVCARDGAELASIDSSYEQSFISSTVQQGASDAWIGLKREADGGSFQWSDGWPVLFSHWGPGEPSGHEGEGCVSLHGNTMFLQGTWNETRCEEEKPFICKITKEKPPATPAPGSGRCLSGWHHYGRYCYLSMGAALISGGVSWPEARHICQEVNGGDLASIHSRAEMEFLRTINTTKGENTWIGLTRDRSLGWAWTDRSALSFTNWAAGEPNQAIHDGDTLKENCGEMYSDGSWNDNICSQRKGFICRHRQYYVTDDNGIVIPTDALAGLKPGPAGFFSSHSSSVDVPAFNNPNFSGESDS